MRTVRTLSPWLPCAALLGCTNTQDLGTRPSADAAYGEDSGTLVLDAGSRPATDAAVDAPPPANDGDAGSARIVLFGGTPDGVNYFGDTWTFDGTEWSLVNVNGPPARSDAIAATLGGKMVVFGGGGPTDADGGATEYDDTWTFDGSAWTQIATATAPSPRGGSGVAVIGGAMYVYGGSSQANSYLTDTWRFDGATWSQVTTSGPTGPTPTRDAFGMGETANGKAVFFGGDTSTGDFLNDTWVFDGTTWSQVTTGAAPSVRIVPKIVPWNGGALLWGGLTGGGMLADTWTFDGTAWTQVNVVGPGSPDSIPANPSAAVLGSTVVLFGGDSAVASNATFVFDGASWSQVDFSSHPAVPAARTAAAMATIP